MKQLLLLTISCGALLSLGACSETKETLGLTKTVPDEFVVVKRAPLEMPPDYALRPPQPGASRPQEATASEDAQKAIFGTSQASSSANSGEGAFLQQATKTQADPNIRAKLDEEINVNTSDNRPVIKRIMNPSGKGEEADAVLVDAQKEKERILTNIEEGKSVTDGATPTLDR